eukprot:TRINITY_DN882_c0_g1_i1.p1 TRINITY_DN882_c0_g1~~TRINITY_DN882_c0_g1_i1.p1  ORF type:complete len:150 (+),score=23.69 TRINITY_DN882_c0_g1_i1:113-562(+)
METAGNDYIDFNLSKLKWSDVDSLEEEERSYRMDERRLDPVAVGKKFRMLQSLTHTNPADLSITGKAISPAQHTLADTAHNVADFTSKQLNTMFDQAAQVVESAIGMLGIGKAATSSEAELERARNRDPDFDVKKQEYEQELISSVRVW